MILLSAALVGVAILCFIIGVTQTGLTFIYASMAASILSFAALIAGVVSGRKKTAELEGSTPILLEDLDGPALIEVETASPTLIEGPIDLTDDAELLGDVDDASEPMSDTIAAAPARAVRPRSTSPRSTSTRTSNGTTARKPRATTAKGGAAAKPRTAAAKATRNATAKPDGDKAAAPKRATTRKTTTTPRKVAPRRPAGSTTAGTRPKAERSAPPPATGPTE